MSNIKEHQLFVFFLLNFSQLSCVKCEIESIGFEKNCTWLISPETCSDPELVSCGVYYTSNSFHCPQWLCQSTDAEVDESQNLGVADERLATSTQFDDDYFQAFETPYETALEKITNNRIDEVIFHFSFFFFLIAVHKSVENRAS